MRGTVLYGPRDVRFEERDVPKIIKPTDAIIRISCACVCGSDLWPYRGIQQFLSRLRWGTNTAASSTKSEARSNLLSPVNS
jgi:threonine dehydrogenase-like Zn-dependent dehydrogenase